MSKDAPIKDNGDLDLIDWHRVAQAVRQAFELLGHSVPPLEPSEVAKQTALNCIQEAQDYDRLTKAGFTAIGGFWCRIEDGKIATYTRTSALKQLGKADA